MSRYSSGGSQSGGTGSSRMVQPLLPESSARLHLEPYPLGDETGLPLIPCPDCGLARVIERRSAKDTTVNHLRVFFKCPRNAFPKLCGFYKFQRDYLFELKKLGIVTIRTAPATALEIADEAVEGGDATSGNTERQLKVEAKKDGKESKKLEKKMEDLLWKFNMLIFLFAVVLGAGGMYLAVK